jgi:hypothetical protein
MGLFGAYEAAQALANKGKLSIVTMGTADFSLISNISTNIISWQDMTQPPINWAQLFWNTYDCKLFKIDIRNSLYRVGLNKRTLYIEQIFIRFDRLLQTFWEMRDNFIQGINCADF